MFESRYLEVADEIRGNHIRCFQHWDDLDPDLDLDLDLDLVIGFLDLI